MDRRYTAMTKQQQKRPWWELPPKSPGEPDYRSEREWLRAELSRAWRALLDEPADAGA
jgi:hypothetical protein